MILLYTVFHLSLDINFVVCRYTIPGKRTPGGGAGMSEDSSGDFEVELFLITVSGLHKLLGKIKKKTKYLRQSL
jgi:hypothetical protein